MSKRGILTLAAGAAIFTLAGTAPAQVIVNGGGELYDPTSSGAADDIAQSPVPPGDGTGWNATTNTVGGNRGVEAIGTTANPQGADEIGVIGGSVKRLAFGSTGAADAGGIAVAPEDAKLFQLSSHTVAEGDLLTLTWQGRGYFNYDSGVDAQASFFGYLDGGNIVEVSTQLNDNILDDSDTAVFIPAVHSYAVTAGSDLIGRQLVVGFYTDIDAFGTGATAGGFSAVDNVALAIPEPTSLAVLGLGGLTLLRRRRA